LSPVRFARVVETPSATTMTFDGVMGKTGILLLCVLLPAAYVWYLFFGAGYTQVGWWIIIGIGGGLVTALITMFKPRWAGISAPLYGVFQGFALGGISAVSEAVYPGIVVPAVALTFGVLGVMVLLYATRIIKVTQKLRMGITAAVGAVMFVYLFTILFSLFGVRIPFVFEGGPIGILFSVFVVGLAAFSLLLDFDRIEWGVNSGAPKYMEWYAAFGLMVTLIWLYIEILRLLGKTRR
jgi:uncharacterized YccA/Bax inhibitor family protein